MKVYSQMWNFKLPMSVDRSPTARPNTILDLYTTAIFVHCQVCRQMPGMQPKPKGMQCISILDTKIMID
eukprot:4041005-Karenia_brevis.AAC.1